MPGIPGSLERVAEPRAMTTKRARMSSSRLVRMCHRLASSSQSIDRTRVWKWAFSYSPYCCPIRCECSKISETNEYFSFGM